jgi:hypothetical protein
MKCDTVSQRRAMMAWVGSMGAVLLQDSEVAKLSEWRFELHPLRETEDNLAGRLQGVRGHFRIAGEASETLLDAIRSRKTLTLRCNTSWGVVDAEVEAEPNLANLPDASRLTELLFPFTVTGDVYRSEAE